MLDLDYPEDSKAQADANFVLTGDGGIVEVQGTAEEKPFTEPQFIALMDLAKKGVGELARLQRLAIGKPNGAPLRRPKLVVATHNRGKAGEIRAMLAPLGIEIVSAGELGLPAPEETGTTFEENATLKALAATRASGLPALADDSGLSVHALDGQPGVHTADWEGPTRDAMVGMRRIQDELASATCPTPTRPAPPHSIACWRWPGPTSMSSWSTARSTADRLAAARQRRPWLRSLLPAHRRHAHHGGDERRREKRH